MAMNSFFYDYPSQPVSGAFNELFSQNGQMRPVWKRFFNPVLTEGFEKFSFYAEQTKRLFHSDSDNASSFSHGFIPFMLSEKDFHHLEQGLIQRANVLNQMLKDLYTEQNLLKKGVLPASIVFSHPFYLASLKNVYPKEKVFLTEYTVDVERAFDGRFWVVDESTQIPRNIGTTVKNRLILSRIMPEIYEKASPKRIFHLLQTISEHIVNLSSINEKPNIVLLVKSTQDTADNENSFLARNLGFSIVEPADLSVRNNHVYLKNMNGLKHVDIILRCIEDDLCDPLELNGASTNGIAGLTQAVRSGNIIIANPLGSGTAQIPALKAFIHGICRFFTNEELILPSLATWWCGQKKERDYVIKNKERLRLLNAVNGRDVTNDFERIEQTPEQFIAQESVNASLAPVFHQNKIFPAPVRLRFHLIWDKGCYKMMPGGCAFTKIRKQTFLHDIWIPETKKNQRPQTLVLANKRLSKPIRSTFDLTSHTAENMFWLGRYLERSEDLTRLMRAVVRRLVDSPEIPEPHDIMTLLNALYWLGYIPYFDVQDNNEQQKAIENVLNLIKDRNVSSGLYSLFSTMKTTADLLRDRLSADTWEIFTNLSRFLPEKECSKRTVLNRLEQIILHQNALSGLIRENMTREISWRFMEIGRRLERAIHVLDIMGTVDICAKNGFNAALETLLETSDSRMTYRARYLATPVVPLVFDLLVCDETNPRSVIYQILKLRQNICKIALESHNGHLFDKEKALLEEILSNINAIDVSCLAPDASQTYGKTVDLNPSVITNLTDLRQKLTTFSDSLTLTCFVHASSTRQGPVYRKE